ncbi:MAG: N-acetyltransferase [Solirubrobacterales bacterium]|nr:N-acetyltransferase [Solirubrobacterales bacterium]
MQLRHAEPSRDAAACAEIYAPFVADSVISLEVVPPGPEEFARRIERISTRYPWLVAELGDEMAGFAYGSLHRERAAYRWAAESTVYIDPAHQRRGIGRSLYLALFDLLRRQGLQIVYAGITLPNRASVALHEALGFELVGVYRRIAWKFGAWHDVGWWQLDLVPPEPQAPPEPGPPVRLDQR